MLALPGMFPNPHGMDPLSGLLIAIIPKSPEEMLSLAGNLVDGIPVVGHTKGLIHYACGDSEGGDSAMKAASHSTAVAAGGAAGFIVGGPVGAAALGIAAGAYMDTAITIIDTEINGTVNGKIRAYGITEPLSDPTNPDKWINAGCGVILDGVAAGGVGERVGRMAMARSTARNECCGYLVDKVKGNVEVTGRHALLNNNHYPYVNSGKKYGREGPFENKKRVALLRYVIKKLAGSRN